MNKKIIVTAPEIYNKRFSDILQKKFNPIPFPSIENAINILKDHDSFFKIIKEVEYVILPSRNAIKSFFQNASSINIQQNSFKTIKFITIGKDEDYLKEFGFSNSLNVEEASPVGIYKALKKLKVKINKVALFAPKVEIISEPDIIPNFIKLLKELTEVVRIDAYTTRPKTNFNNQTLNLILKNNFDYILFTSGAEIEAFFYLIGQNKILKKESIICFGPYTASTAIKLGFTPFYIGKQFSSFFDFTLELEHLFRKNKY